MFEVVLTLTLGMGAAMPADVEHPMLGGKRTTTSSDALCVVGPYLARASQAQITVDREPVFKLSALDGRVNDRLGTALAISGTTTVVGARWADIGEDNESGAAYVFEKHGDGWALQAKLVASDGWWLSSFGSSVALEGNTLVVGAQGHVAGSVQRGAAYVFTRVEGVWVESARLSPGEFGGGPSAFGASVGVCGGVIFVGAAESRFGAGDTRASVSVFVRDETGWRRQALLVGDDSGLHDRFGQSLACSEDVLLVGSPRADTNGAIDQGAAYVFRRTQGLWGQEAKLVASDGIAGDLAGWSVALEGDTAVLGARGDTSSGSQTAGAAYVFKRNSGTWHQRAKLVAADGEAGDQFGEAVAISGATIVIGARLDDSPDVIDVGSAHAFRWDGRVWAWQGRLSPLEAAGSIKFGTAVALLNETAIVSAPEENIDQVTARGAAYVFDGMQPMFWSGFETEAAVR